MDVAVSELPEPAVHDEIVPARGSTAFEVRRGRTVRVEDLEGEQAIDLICYSLDDLGEKFWVAHTVKLNGSIYLTTGHVLYSDRARPMMTIVDDTVGINDVICGSCSLALDLVRYGEEKATRGCMDLFEDAVRPWGLARKDVPMCLNIFLDYPVEDEGLVATSPSHPVSDPGDHLDLRAEMDLLVAVTACPQENNPCNGYHPTPIRVAVY
jgi:urea carboxylase-associated protein 1